MSMSFRKIAHIRKISFSVVGIKIQKDTAFFQDTYPFFISMTYMRQGPGKIPGNDHIKSFIREIRIFCIHYLELTVCILLFCKKPGIFDHIRCQVYTSYLMSFF